MTSTIKRSIKKGDSVLMRKGPDQVSTSSDSESELPPETVSPRSFWTTQPQSPSDSVSSTQQIAVNNNNFPKMQLSITMSVLAVATAIILEPIYSGKVDFEKAEASNQKKKGFTFGQRLAYVILNSTYPLLWIVTIEVYNEYLRSLDNVNRNSQQTSTIESRVKMTEKLHGRSLSQFVVMIFCELTFVFDLRLVPILTRIVPVFNCLYLVGRIAEFVQPIRYRMFCYLISYTPLIVCVIVCSFIQSYKTLVSVF